MSNIKWSGIEQWKYGLTARWYVSAYYGNDIDVDVVGLYNPSTNPTGHGGPTRPFSTADKAIQQAAGLLVFDSGYYSFSSALGDRDIVGDGNIVIANSNITGNKNIYNCSVISCFSVGTQSRDGFRDCFVMFSNVRTMGS